MVSKDIFSYITQNYEDNLDSITKLSETGRGQSLVIDERELYNFDDITTILYNNIKCPTSADSLLVTKRIVEFVEFKSGFHKKITKKNCDYSKLSCLSDNSKTCMGYADLLFKKQDLETDELLDSLKMKAIESYMTLEKKILPKCESYADTMHIRLVFCVVVDDYIDVMEDTLNELANETSDSNTITQVKSSLSRFVNHKDTAGNDYLYDELKVLSPHEFILHMNQTMD